MQVRTGLSFALGSCVVYFLSMACTAAVEAVAGADGASSSSSGSSGSMVNGGATMAFADTFKSGTRLRLQYFESVDGARVFAGVFDTKYNVQCSHGSKAADGKLRCLPVTTELPEPARYSDSSCTKPALNLPAGTPRAPFYRLPGTQNIVAPVGERLNAFVYMKVNTSCGIAGTEGRDTFVVEAAAPESFAETPLITE